MNSTTLTTTTDAAANILAAAQKDSGFEKLLKFKKGSYEIEKEDVPLGTEYLAHCGAWIKTWIKFVDNNVVDRKIYRVAKGEVPPEREELDDNDESTWPRRDGKPADPWVYQYLLPFEDMASGEIVIFSTSSFGGRIAISDLAKAYAKRVRAGKSGQPIIKLDVAEMQTKNYGAVKKPKFEVVGWDDAEAGDAEAAAHEVEAEIPLQAKRATKTKHHADMDDEIPF